MHKILLFFLFGFSLSLHAQEYVFGKVSTEEGTALEGVLVLNIRTDEKVFTDADGNFMIRAKKTDRLRFVKQKYERATHQLQAEDFKIPLAVVLLKAVQEIKEIDLNKTLTGNLREDVSRVEVKKTVKLQKELRKYIAQKSDPLILSPRAGEFLQPKGEGFSIGRVSNRWDAVDVAEGFLEILGEDYFLELGLKKEEISPFVFFVLRTMQVKEAKKRGYLSAKEISSFKMLAEEKVEDFTKRQAAYK